MAQSHLMLALEEGGQPQSEAHTLLLSRLFQLRDRQVQLTESVDYVMGRLL